MGTEGRNITERGVNILLIGNGPAALAKEMGEAVDNFDGIVVRFNDYTVKGYEKYVGTRTDCWITTSVYRPMEDVHKYRYYLTERRDEATYKSAERINAEFIDKSVWQNLPYYPPSSGALAVEFFRQKGHSVYLWGFDFLSTRRPHHYNNDGADRGVDHNELDEWLYFQKMHEQGGIKWFGLEEGESSPIFRQPVPCGSDKDLSWYRTAAHNAWYEWFGSMSKGMSILDVGAGMCEGMKILDKYSPEVKGIEVDERLKALDDRLIIGSLDDIEDNSFDVITCVDVIEHVVKDLALMNNMKRIAKKAVYVTTPCYVRSRCGNIAHCREYSIPQFMNFFKPSEIWSASPDGTIHRTKLLSKKGELITNYSSEGPDNKIQAVPIYHYDRVPVDTKFNNTVDKEEWAHIAACFYDFKG